MSAFMTWVGVDDHQPYPWSTVPCPGCGEPELAGAVTRRTVDFVCMACGTITQICRHCLNGGHVCENHPEHPWAGEVGGEECCGGPGMPCPSCCDSIPMDGSHRIGEAFTPRHVRGAQ